MRLHFPPRPVSPGEITWGTVTEHREHARAPIALRVEYKKLNSFFADYTKNISKGGNFIKTKKPLPAGTRFIFELTVPSCGIPFALTGEVVWVGRGDGAGMGMGIRFVWSDEAARGGFERAVERLMAESLGPVVAARLLDEAARK
jgi:type IV pilus assembly protein PilZ